MTKIFTWICCAVYAISMTTSLLAVDPIAIEKSYTEKIQTALDGVFGKGQFVARVSLTATGESWNLTYTEQARVRVETKKQEEGKYQILPGYPVIRNLATGQQETLPFNSRLIKIEPRIQSIVVDVIVNRSFPKSNVKKAEDLITKIVGLTPARGDKINFDYQVFLEPEQPTQNIVMLDKAEKIFSAANILNAGLLLAIIAGLVLYTLFQFLHLRKAGEVKAAAAGGGPNISVNPNIELPKGLGGGGAAGVMKMSGTPGIKKYFDYVQEDNVDKLLYMMKKEKMPVDQIAIIVSFLDSFLASRVISELDVEQQAFIATSIIDQKLLQRPVVEKLDMKVKDSLECLMGGPSIFQNIFGQIPSDGKKRILEVLGKTSAEGYKRFRTHIVIFEDLKYLDDEELKVVLSELNLEQLAKALVGIGKDVYDKVEMNLTKSAKDMIDQFLKLKGKAISRAEVDKAQSYVLDVALKMESEGKINLKEKIGKA